MHIFFSGIGGAGIGPLALIAHQAGYSVSGSDKQSSQYTEYLQNHGIRLHIGQTREQIAAVHNKTPIDWVVYTSALTLEQAQPAELVWAQENGVRTSRRDEMLSTLLRDKKLDLIAIAGTHGKTTTTAMVMWLLQQLGIAVSYSVGAKTSFADMGHFDPESRYFVYECDEFDRNFLAFQPAISVITSVDWDHHDVYPTRADYKQAFRDFIGQSRHVALHAEDADYLALEAHDQTTVISPDDPLLQHIRLAGTHNRRNATVAIRALERFAGFNSTDMIKAIEQFPGSSRRMELIAAGVYSDYAHTPEEIRATLQLASELSNDILVVYEPLTNRRQHFMKEQYGDCFDRAQRVLWLPSYLAREDPNMHVYTPQELIAYLPKGTPASPHALGQNLAAEIREHVKNGGIVVCMAGGGGGCLDEWLRSTFASDKTKGTGVAHANNH